MLQAVLSMKEWQDSSDPALLSMFFAAANAAAKVLGGGYPAAKEWEFGAPGSGEYYCWWWEAGTPVVVEWSNDHFTVSTREGSVRRAGAMRDAAERCGVPLVSGEVADDRPPRCECRCGCNERPCGETYCRLCATGNCGETAEATSDREAAEADLIMEARYADWYENARPDESMAEYESRLEAEKAAETAEWRAGKEVGKDKEEYW
jgi:hypothetical protein